MTYPNRKPLTSADLGIDQETGLTNVETAIVNLAALITGGRLKVDASGINLSADLVNVENVKLQNQAGDGINPATEEKQDAIAAALTAMADGNTLVMIVDALGDLGGGKDLNDIHTALVAMMNTVSLADLNAGLAEIQTLLDETVADGNSLADVATAIGSLISEVADGSDLQTLLDDHLSPLSDRAGRGWTVSYKTGSTDEAIVLQAAMANRKARILRFDITETTGSATDVALVDTSDGVTFWYRSLAVGETVSVELAVPYESASGLGIKIVPSDTVQYNVTVAVED